MYESEGYFEQNLEGGVNEKIIPGHGRIRDYKKLYSNVKSKREFKGAMTNSASFDNDKMNLVDYTDGQITTSALSPNLLNLIEAEKNEKMLQPFTNKASIVLENTVTSKY